LLINVPDMYIMKSRQ